MKLDLKKNLTLKLLSLLIAILLWAVVAGEEEFVRDFALPLELTNMPSSLELSGPVVDTVVVRVRAPEAILTNLTADRMSVRINLRDAHSGDNPFILTPKQVRVPSGSEVVDIDPGIVELRLEPKRQKEIPVNPAVEGTPAPGYEVTRVTVTPATILVEGPESELEETVMATTGLIPLHGDETGTRRVSVNPVPRAPEESRVRVLNPAPALVIIEIREKTDRRSFPSVPVTGVGAEYRSQIAPEVLQVTVEGPASLIRRLGRDDLLVEIPLAGLEPREEDYRIEPRVVFPQLSPEEARRLVVAGMSQTFVNVKVYNQRTEP